MLLKLPKYELKTPKYALKNSNPRKIRHLEVREKCSTWEFGNKLHFQNFVFRVKRAFGNSGKMRSGNARSDKRRSTLDSRVQSRKIIWTI